jgi:hypothetical protein
VPYSRPAWKWNSATADSIRGLAAVREEHATMRFDWIRSRQIHPTVSAQSMADWTDNEFHIGEW